jgi:hypothetical protein
MAAKQLASLGFPPCLRVISEDWPRRDHMRPKLRASPAATAIPASASTATRSPANGPLVSSAAMPPPPTTTMLQMIRARRAATRLLGTSVRVPSQGHSRTLAQPSVSRLDAVSRGFRVRSSARAGYACAKTIRPQQPFRRSRHHAQVPESSDLLVRERWAPTAWRSF